MVECLRCYWQYRWNQIIEQYELFEKRQTRRDGIFQLNVDAPSSMCWRPRSSALRNSHSITLRWIGWQQWMFEPFLHPWRMIRTSVEPPSLRFQTATLEYGLLESWNFSTNQNSVGRSGFKQSESTWQPLHWQSIASNQCQWHWLPLTVHESLMLAARWRAIIQLLHYVPWKPVLDVQRRLEGTL